MTEIAIRDLRPDDLRYVMDSWLKSYLAGRTHAWRHVDYKRAVRGHRRVVDELRKRARIRIAVDPAADFVILGWACADSECLHYVYVKKKFRRAGIARVLIEDAGSPRFYSHPTVVGRKVLQQRLAMKESPGHALYPPISKERAA